MNNLRIGWSERDITPKDKRIGLDGQFFDRYSEYVESPLSVTALAIETGGEQTVMVSCDLVGIKPTLIADVRAKVKVAIPELDTSKIIMNATHTHTSYVYRKDVPGVGGGLRALEKYVPAEMRPGIPVPENTATPNECHEFIACMAAEAVIEAWNKRAPSYYANEFGRAVIGHNRRVVYDDFTAKMYGDTKTANFYMPEAGEDSGVEMLYFFDENKNLTGVAVNIACPSQVVEHRRYISSDYWGKAKVLLREKFGKDLFVLGLCSAAGDISPRDMVRWVNPINPIDDPNIKRTHNTKRVSDTSMFEPEGTWELGRRVARVVEDRLEAAREAMRDTDILKHKKVDMDFPIRTVSITEYEQAKRDLNEHLELCRGKEKLSFEDSAKLHLCCGTMDRFELQQKASIVTKEIHFIRFGDVAIATNPFELFLNYGLRIKARCEAPQTFLIQLCCDGAGYLPTPEAERGSHYSAYVSSGITGHEGGNLLVSKTLSELNKFFS